MDGVKARKFGCHFEYSFGPPLHFSIISYLNIILITRLTVIPLYSYYRPSIVQSPLPMLGAADSTCGSIALNHPTSSLDRRALFRVGGRDGVTNTIRSHTGELDVPDITYISEITTHADFQNILDKPRYGYS